MKHKIEQLEQFTGAIEPIRKAKQMLAEIQQDRMKVS
jgi:hypothetical protein